MVAGKRGIFELLPAANKIDENSGEKNNGVVKRGAYRNWWKENVGN